MNHSNDDSKNGLRQVSRVAAAPFSPSVFLKTEIWLAATGLPRVALCKEERSKSEIKQTEEGMPAVRTLRLQFWLRMKDENRKVEGC